MNKQLKELKENAIKQMNEIKKKMENMKEEWNKNTQILTKKINLKWIAYIRPISPIKI
jgi:hypothetical protein